jgi:predicted nucleic-acid-binding Zn-ribbon protein
MSWFKQDPISVEVQGRVLKCLVCGHDEFWKKEAQLNTAGASFFNLEWTSPSGVCYLCSQCGYIHWFLPQ